MKFCLSLILLASFVLMFGSAGLAQNETDPVIKATNLRLALIDVQTKDAELQIRAQQLDEDLKPENIQSALAGIGSLHPEELREQRRRQLQLEKDRVLAQLKQLAQSRADLESAIVTADAEAYQQSAKGTSSSQALQMLKAQYSSVPGWLVGTLMTLVLALGLVAVVMIIRQRRRLE